MAKHLLDTDVWIKVSEYANQRNVDRRLVFYWIKAGYLEEKRIPEYDLVLVKRGTESGKAILSAPVGSHTPLTPALPKKRSPRFKKATVKS
jgi:hypothetical protein